MDIDIGSIHQVILVLLKYNISYYCK